MKAKKLILFPGLIAVSLAVMVSCNDSTETTTTTTTEDSLNKVGTDTSTSNKLSSAESTLISDLVGGNYGEVKAAQLAKQKSTNADVKQVAEMLENDHTAVLNDLKNFASKYNVSIPVEEDQASKDLVTDLSDETGKTFDKKWVDAMVDKHEKSIKKVESADVTNSELKTWAGATLPKLHEHHTKLKEIQGKLK